MDEKITILYEHPDWFKPLFVALDRRGVSYDKLYVGDTPPAEIIAQAKQIMAASQSDLGGVEYLVNEIDGQIYFYDINPLSNFVANAMEVVGRDPTERFVDFILARRRDSRRPAAYK